MKKIIISVFLFMVLFPRNVYAGYGSGQELLISCTGANDDPIKAAVDQTHCLGYIDGVIDTVALIGSIYPDIKFFCLPSKGIEVGDGMSVVIPFILQNPEARTMPARTVIMKALGEKYPCVKKNE